MHCTSIDCIRFAEYSKNGIPFLLSARIRIRSATLFLGYLTLAPPGTSIRSSGCDHFSPETETITLGPPARDDSHSLNRPFLPPLTSRMSTQPTDQYARLLQATYAVVFAERSIPTRSDSIQFYCVSGLLGLGLVLALVTLAVRQYRGLDRWVFRLSSGYILPNSTLLWLGLDSVWLVGAFTPSPRHSNPR